jgi:hypothetical protein
MQYVNTSKGKYLSFLGILSFLAIPSADNPAHYLLIPVLIAVYGLYFTFISKQKDIFIKLILTILVLLSISAVWLLPSFTYLHDESHFPTSNLIDWNDLKVESASEFSEIFRFLGFWVLKGSVSGEYYFPYWRIYYSYFFILSGFGIFIFSLLNLLIYKDKNQLFFAILMIFSIFFMKGMSPPLESVNMWLYQNVPYFFAFRQPYEKFGAFFVFSVAVLLGFSTQVILAKLDSVKNNMRVKRVNLLCTSIVILLLINVYAWPFWTGDIFPQHDRASILKSARVTEIPESYVKIAETVNNQHNIFRIIGLPGGTRLGWTPFTWGYIGSNPLYHYIAGKSFFIAPGGPWAYNQPLMDRYLLNLEHQSEFSKLVKVSGYLNFKYIILDKSVDNRIYDWITNPEVIDHELTNTSGIEFVKSYGSLYLYKFSDDFFLPRIYSTTNPIVVEGDIDDMFKVMSSIPTGNYVFILSNGTNERQYKLLKTYTNTIFISKKMMSVPVYNGSEIPFNWVIENKTIIDARYYVGWKSVIRTDGKEVDDTLSFSSLNECPYIFPSFSPTGWSAFNSTLLYIITGAEPLGIDNILEGENSIVRDLVGVWWQTDWMGMGTKQIKFPIIIPPNQKAIIQLNHIIKDNNLTLFSIDLSGLTKLNKDGSSMPWITFKQINPTKYVVEIENATQPFFLVLSESYNIGWKIYTEENNRIELNKVIYQYPNIKVRESNHEEYKFSFEDILFIFKKPAMDENYHFIANGYANAWYIDPSFFNKNGNDKFTVIIYFRQQSYSYLGILISLITLLGCIDYLIAYAFRSRIKDLNKLFKHFLRRKVCRRSE